MLLENIRARCADRGITIAELERKTSIGNGVIAKWKDGTPRLTSVQKVADFFGCTVDDLLSDLQTNNTTQTVQ